VCFFNGGSLCVLNGSQFKITLADGTTATFGGGDLVVNGISLTKHLHTGVTPGGGNTGKPI
jgi:phage baseplate assembly protein gpV